MKLNRMPVENTSGHPFPFLIVEDFEWIFHFQAIIVRSSLKKCSTSRRDFFYFVFLSLRINNLALKICGIQNCIEFQHDLCNGSEKCSEIQIQRVNNTVDLQWMEARNLHARRTLRHDKMSIHGRDAEATWKKQPVNTFSKNCLISKGQTIS